MSINLVTAGRPKCAHCKEPILNQMSTAADGKIYHIYHFQCCWCHVVLTDHYTTHQGQIYCTECHKKIAIDNKCTSKFYFLVKICTLQNYRFIGTFFVLISCNCLFLVCNNALDEKSFQIMNCHYHFECFTCATCDKPFEQGIFYPVGDEIYCLMHHWQARLNLEREQRPSQKKKA